MRRQEIAQETAAALRRTDVSAFSGVLGFDGFVDDIIDVVHERTVGGGYHDYVRIPTLKEYGNRVAATAGQGTNVELVVKRQKLGGNGPIMGNALARLGMGMTYMGAVGDGAGGVHPVFGEFASRAKVIPLADAARTHALEFEDGKLMMGELGSLSEITFERVLEVVGKERLIELCAGASLLGLLNWTMIPAATAVWRGFAEHVLPSLRRKPRVFVDLADPKKRTNADLGQALGVLTQINAAGAPVTLGLNEAESRHVAAALALRVDATPQDLAGVIRTKLALDTVVVHPTHSAAAATKHGVVDFAGPYTAKPAILTGGGDHFNAGFSLGQWLNLSLEQALCLATATSGYYVRNAESPTRDALTDFLAHLPDPV